MAAADRNLDEPQGYGAPAHYGEAVTPHASNDLAYVSRAIYVGGGGDLTVVMAGDGAVVLFKAVPTGSLLPLAVKRVNAIGTTATFITAIS